MKLQCLRKTTLLLLFTFIHISCHAKANTNKNAVIDDIFDIKDFKKLLRTRTNVLVFYVSNSKYFPVELKTFRDAAKIVKGFGTMVLIECETSTERKKLCKKLKVTPETYTIKHYKDGDFHKDYQRKLCVNSIVNFMRDPTGDLPWDEDPTGANVLHFADHVSFKRHIVKDTRPMMVMFYVTWCGFCKRLKPQYSEAATELKSKGLILAAMDLEKQENAPIRKFFNITGFPTLIYFENGQKKLIYEGETSKEGLIAFMQNPNVKITKSKIKEADWSADANSEVVHLTTEGFDETLSDEKSVLVMFYAPWCGHCKRLKPEYEKAATMLKEQKIPGILAALDATKEVAIGQQFGVKGYPTLKYFVNGEFKYEVNLRDAEKLVAFMRDPKEPPPPPPPEKSWEEEEGNEDVVFLTDQNFNTTLKRKKHALVMFYAPWCGHCKITKPEFAAAAKSLHDDTRILFGAVDCTHHTKVCAAQSVQGYPTIKYFSYLKTQVPYTGGRTKDDFVSYMTTQHSGKQKQEL